jgi:enoyl-CoA hydratase
MSGGSLVRVEQPGDRVAVLVLDRPNRLNALSSELAAGLAEAVAEVEADPEVRALVVAGEGRCFSAGADITDLEGLDGPHAFAAFVRGLEGALAALARCPLPSVAAVHGVALGGGLELALACDLRVAESTARLGVPEIKLGLLPAAAGTARLSRMLPPAVAKQLLLTGEPLDAATAYRLGLVNDVVDEGAAGDAAVDLAARLAALPPLALAAGKRLVDEGGQMPLDSAIAFERETVAMLFGTEDRAEGIRAFLDKRPPSFTGR